MDRMDRQHKNKGHNIQDCKVNVRLWLNQSKWTLTEFKILFKRAKLIKVKWNIFYKYSYTVVGVSKYKRFLWEKALTSGKLIKCVKNGKPVSST